jgi:hypothetical protein
MELTPDLKKDMMAAVITQTQRLAHDEKCDWTDEMRSAAILNFILGVEAAFAVASDYLENAGLTSLPKELVTDLADTYHALMGNLVNSVKENNDEVQ